MLGRLFKTRNDADRAAAYRERMAAEQTLYLEKIKERAADYAEKRTMLLKSGGTTLGHRPRQTEGWEAAILRMHQEGFLREQIEFGSGPEARIYRYTLTPLGERAAKMPNLAGLSG